MQHNRLGSIKIIKQTDPADTTSFGFDGDLGNFTLSNGSNKIFNNLMPDTYTINEKDTTGWYLDSIVCNGGNIVVSNSNVTIQLGTSENITCTFYNLRLSVTADAGSTYSGKEGAHIALNANGTTNKEMVQQYKWDCTNDGFFEKSSSSPTGKSCKYNDNGAYTVKLRTVDIFGQTSDDLAPVRVRNVPPTVNAGPNKTAYAGEVVSFSGSFSDPGTADTHAILWTFGDGNSASGSLTPKHTYDTAGTYEVKLTVTDDDGASDADILTVAVQNRPPELSEIMVNPGEIDEGASFTLYGNISETNPGGDLVIDVDWGDGMKDTLELPTGSTSFSLVHACADDDPSGTTADTYKIDITLTDDKGATASGTAEIKVNNLPPVIDAGPDKVGILGQPITFSAFIFDPGAPDTHTVTWDFGDGSPTASGTEISHTFKEAGEFTVTVIAEDDDGGVGQIALNIVIGERRVIFLPLILGAK